jgi:MtfA peptidase
VIRKRPIPDDLRRLSVSRYPFVAALTEDEILRLRRLSTLFMNDKEFSGAGDMHISDEVAAAVALQACLPAYLELGTEPPRLPWRPFVLSKTIAVC